MGIAEPQIAGLVFKRPLLEPSPSAFANADSTERSASRMCPNSSWACVFVRDVFYFRQEFGSALGNQMSTVSLRTGDAVSLKPSE